MEPEVQVVHPNPKKRKLQDTDLQPSHQLQTRSSKRLQASSVPSLVDYLHQHSEEHSRRHPPKEKSFENQVKRVRIYRHHNPEKVAFIIFLRFGSLTDDSPG